MLPHREPLSQWWPGWQVSPRGVRGFYVLLQPSQAVDRRFTPYNTQVLCLYYYFTKYLHIPQG